MRTKPYVWSLILLSGCANGVGPTQEPAHAPAATMTASREIPWVSPPDEGTGLMIRLRPGKNVPASSPPPAATVSALSPQATETLLARLPALPDAPTVALKRPAEGRPVPKAAPISRPFPAETIGSPTPPPKRAANIAVERRRPEGEVGNVPRVSITFSRPVAPLTSADALGPNESPFILEPKVPGAWRWLSTRTLVFEPNASRLPMATEYRVQSRAGWAASDGARFDEPIGWTFKTAPPRVTGWFPQGRRVDTDALIAVTLDQDVDPEAILSRLKLTVAGAPRALRLASGEERSAAEGPWTERRAPEANRRVQNHKADADGRRGQGAALRRLGIARRTSSRSTRGAPLVLDLSAFDRHRAQLRVAKPMSADHALQHRAEQ